jgi:RHS repeat-associated protein
MYYTQTVPDCTKDPYTVSTTTVTIGKTASLPITWNILNTSWSSFGLTALRIGIDYSTNSRAGISLYPDTTMSVLAGKPGNTKEGTVTYQVQSSLTTLDYNTTDSLLLSTYKTYNIPQTSTSTLYNKSISTTTVYTVLTPFTDYEVDSRNTTSLTISLAGKVVALYSYDTSNPSTAMIQYIVEDELQTPVLYTDTDGKVSRIHTTDTFGNVIWSEVRNDSYISNKSFATYSTLPGSGLLYARARLYDPVTSLFLSQDPYTTVLPKTYITDPEQQNSYSYARNNPVMFNDPTGEVAFLVPFAIAGLEVVALSQAVSLYSQSKTVGATYGYNSSEYAQFEKSHTFEVGALMVGASVSAGMSVYKVAATSIKNAILAEKSLMTFLVVILW